MRQFLAILRSFFRSSLLCTFSCHHSPPTILPSSHTSSCHLFLGLPLNLVPKFIHNTLLGILFPSILCTYPNQRNIFNLVVSLIVGFLTLAKNVWNFKLYYQDCIDILTRYWLQAAWRLHNNVETCRGRVMRRSIINCQLIVHLLVHCANYYYYYYHHHHHHHHYRIFHFSFGWEIFTYPGMQ